MREPMIVWWPGHIQAGTVSDALVTTPDIYPTLLEAAGLPLHPEQHVDGVSFMDALEGKPHKRPPIIWHYPHYGNQGGSPACAIRDGDWKLIHFFEDDSDLLYNLADDPSETTDAAALHPAFTRDLRETLLAYVGKMGGRIPVRHAGYTAWPGRGDGKSKSILHWQQGSKI
ncbi:MAG: DUF4976 domain-containing protein [Eubacteriales bacterium]|nr:DUF4976 domain-containing protein [Eubacteriales bacterium]